MDIAKTKDLINERVRQITFGYSWPGEQKTHIYVASLTRDPDATVTVLHERQHLNLTEGCELGFFETLLGKLITFVDAPPDEIRKAHNIINLTIQNSWMAHESCATYCSVMMSFGLSPAKFSKYYNKALKHNRNYRAAWHTYADIFGGPVEGGRETRILASSYLAECISKAALDVPILGRFRSYAEISEKNVAHFLQEHNPDLRQNKILRQLKERRILGSLREKAESFLTSHTAEHGNHIKLREDLKEQAIIGSHLQKVIMNELHRLMPEIIFWCPIDQRIRQLQEAGENWRSEWVYRGYKNAELLEIGAYAGPEDVIEEIQDEETEQAGIDIFPEVATLMPFYRRKSAHIPLCSVPQHVETLRAIRSDLFVLVIYNPEAQSILFKTSPWQFQGVDRVKDILVASHSNVLAGSCLFSCSVEKVQETIAMLTRLNTIWIQWLGNQNAWVDSGKKLPSLKGSNFVLGANITIGQAIAHCTQLVSEDNLAISLWGANNDATEWEGNTLLIVAMVPNKATYYIFPTTYFHALLFIEAFEDLSNVTFLEEANSVEAIKDIDLLPHIMFLFYGVKSSHMLRRTKKGG